MSPTVKARFQLIGAALLFSTGGAAIKAAAFTGLQIATFRSGFAALALLLLAPGVRRGWTPQAVLVGVAYAACLTLFVLANRLTTAANTIFLQSTAPLYVLILAPSLLKEPVRRQDLVFMLAVGLGLVLFFAGVDETVVTAPDPETGNLLALISGFFWAVTMCGLSGSLQSRVEAHLSPQLPRETLRSFCWHSRLHYHSVRTRLPTGQFSYIWVSFRLRSRTCL
ncbi:MAG TPA: DMT family transporter [Gemmatimonadales bacterium]|nr:DMT family transporter [Gemmatimonadales bacterium]